MQELPPIESHLLLTLFAEYVLQLESSELPDAEVGKRILHLDRLFRKIAPNLTWDNIEDQINWLTDKRYYRYDLPPEEEKP